MFLANQMPAPSMPSSQTSLSVESATPTSEAVAASLERLDNLIRNALGRSVYGNPIHATLEEGAARFGPWTTDDLIAAVTALVFFFMVFVVLLLLKLLLGMVLLRYSRNRYAEMKTRDYAVATGRAERETYDIQGSKRMGGFGQVEVGEERRKRIFEDDPEGLRKAKAKDTRDAEKAKKEPGLDSIKRYEMVAKRIW